MHLPLGFCSFGLILQFLLFFTSSNGLIDKQAIFLSMSKEAHEHLQRYSVLISIISQTQIHLQLAIYTTFGNLDMNYNLIFFGCTLDLWILKAFLPLKVLKQISQLYRNIPGKCIASKWFLTLDGNLALKVWQREHVYSLVAISPITYWLSSSTLVGPGQLNYYSY